MEEVCVPSVKAPADRVERKIVPCFAKPLQTTVFYLRPLQKQKLECMRRNL